MSRPVPESRERYRRFITITTRWMDNDVYQHLNNVVYYSFFDTAVNEYLVSAGVLDIGTSPIVCLVAATGCDYFTPISFPDTVRCGLRVAHLGTSSVRYEIADFAVGDRVTVADYTITERGDTDASPNFSDVYSADGQDSSSPIRTSDERYDDMDVTVVSSQDPESGSSWSVWLYGHHDLVVTHTTTS